MNQAFPRMNAQRNGAQANGAQVNGPQVNGKTLSSWQKQTVQQFFGTVNWDDQPPEIQHLRVASAQDQAQPLSLLLPVNQFFSAFNWEGGAGSAPMPIQPPRPATSRDDDFTLDDFSGLF